LRDDGNPQVYLPYHRLALYDLAVVIKVAGNPMQTAQTARREIESLGGKRPVHDVRPMSDYLEDAVAESRFVLVLLAIFAGLALVLSAFGLYGVIAYTTAQRTGEIGIRLALGATRSHILKWIVGEGLYWSAAGLVLGLAGAAAVTRYLDTLLFGVAPIDALTFLSAATLLMVVAAAAAYLPARRATQIDITKAVAAE
jgi:ABC-type antimicrobial peptide transport system permease subunit